MAEITNIIELSIFASILLFFVAAIAEIGGGYLVWKWLRERKGIVFGLFGGIVLFLYGIIPTWGYFIDKKKPDRFEIIGSVTAVMGAVIIFYAPR